MATINDIARLAGVSAATVSRVLNKSGYASEEATRKVRQAIEELDYVPNQNAVFLKTGSTKTVGVVTTHLSQTASVILTDFILEAESKGYSVTVFLTNRDPKRELDAFDALRSKQVDGIFLIYRTNEWETLFDYTNHGPVVTLQRIDDPRIESVYVDHYIGCRMALEHLWDQGCRKIVNLCSGHTGLNSKVRIKAYEDFCRERGLTPYPSEQFLDFFAAEDGARAADWFHNQTDKPDAFLAQSDAVAAGLTARLEKYGYRLPEDTAVVGFDNLEISELMDVTSVDYGVTQQAQNAFRLLYNQLQQKEQLPLNPLPFRLVERGTTAKQKPASRE